jgi:hypothetical protein
MHMAKVEKGYIPAEYHEGPKALKMFNEMMTQVFRAPKGNTPFAKPKAKKKAVPKGAPKKRASRRKHGKGGD